MKRNSVKIISNKALNTISYFMKNENGEWVHVDSASPLSKKEYTRASLKEIAEKIIDIIDDTYNVGNRGVDIEVECSDDEYKCLKNILQMKEMGISIQEKRNVTSIQSVNKSAKNDERKNELSDQKNTSNVDISFRKRNTCVVIVGKVLSGKTTLIEELGKLNSLDFQSNKKDGYIEYINPDKDQIWYEVNGIDLGKQFVLQAEKEIDKIATNGMDAFIYCFSTSKIEAIETALLLNIKEKYPNTRMLGVLTSCIDEECSDLADSMSDLIGGIKVIPVLAKDKKIKQGTIPAYGLDELTRYIYGAKR